LGCPALSCPLARLWPQDKWPRGPDGNQLSQGAVSCLLMKWVKGDTLGPGHWFLEEIAAALSAAAAVDNSLAESQAQLQSATTESTAADAEHASAIGVLEKSLAESQAQLQSATTESTAADEKHASAIGVLEKSLAESQAQLQSATKESTAADEKHASAIGVLEKSLAESQAQLQSATIELEALKQSGITPYWLVLV
jgi:hypothetical protein